MERNSVSGRADDEAGFADSPKNDSTNTKTPAEKQITPTRAELSSAEQSNQIKETMYGHTGDYSDFTLGQPPKHGESHVHAQPKYAASESATLQYSKTFTDDIIKQAVDIVADTTEIFQTDPKSSLLKGQKHNRESSSISITKKCSESVSSKDRTYIISPESESTSNNLEIAYSLDTSDIYPDSSVRFSDLFSNHSDDGSDIEEDEDSSQRGILSISESEHYTEASTEKDEGFIHVVASGTKNHLISRISSLFGKNKRGQRNRSSKGQSKSLYDVESGRTHWQARSQNISSGLSSAGDQVQNDDKLQGDSRKARQNHRARASKSVHVCCGINKMRIPTDRDRDLLTTDGSSADGSRDSDDSFDEYLFSFLGRESTLSSRTLTETDTEEPGSTPNKILKKPSTNDSKKTDKSTDKEKVCQFPPLMIYYTHVMREFRWHRFFFNHQENVDFSVFEFGNQRGFLCWQYMCLLYTIILHAVLFRMNPDDLYPFPTADVQLCIHTWLGWLLLLRQLIEVVILTYEFYAFPACYLARIHVTPFYWKVVWFLNNIICPNYLACCFMQGFIFSDGDSRPGSRGANVHIILAFFCLVSTVLGAKPVRIAHALQPLILPLMFVVYSNVYRPCAVETSYFDQPMGYKLNRVLVPAEKRLRISECSTDPIMCAGNRFNCSLYTTLWLTVTIISHLSLVLLSWCRRVAFRGRRDKSMPVFGQSPVTYFLPQFGAESSPIFTRKCHQSGFSASQFVTGHDISPPYFRSTRAVQRRGRGKATRGSGFKPTERDLHGETRL